MGLKYVCTCCQMGDLVNYVYFVYDELLQSRISYLDWDGYYTYIWDVRMAWNNMNVCEGKGEFSLCDGCKEGNRFYDNDLQCKAGIHAYYIYIYT